MKNDKSIKLEDVYYCLDNNKRNSPEFSMWILDIDPDDHGYGDGDASNVYGTALNVITKEEGICSGYTIPTHIDIEREDEFGNVETKHLYCEKLKSIIYKDENKVGNKDTLKTIYNHLVILDYQGTLSINDLVRFDTYINQRLNEYVQKLKEECKEGKRFEARKPEELERCKKVSKGLRKLKNKKAKTIVNNDELSM